MSANQLYNGISVSSSFGPTSCEWPGGDGWIMVDTGTFVGSAHLSLTLAIPSPWGISGVLPISGPVNATGVFPFNAPRGMLSCSLIMGAGESISNLTVYAVSMAGSDI